MELTPYIHENQVPVLNLLRQPIEIIETWESDISMNRQQTNFLIIPSIMYDAAIRTPTNHRIEPGTEKRKTLYHKIISSQYFHVKQNRS